MDRVLIVTLALACLACAVSCQLDDWIKSVDKLGDNITFPCLINGVHPKEENITDKVVEWMLPSFKRVGPGDCLGRASVDADGWTLYLHNVQKSDLGVYHCMMQNENATWRLIKWGLNMRGPYFENVVEKYTRNIILGLSTFGGFLLLAAAVYLLYAFRWKPPTTEEPKRLMEDPTNPSNEPPTDSRQHIETMDAEKATVITAAAMVGEPDIPGTVPYEAALEMDMTGQSSKEHWTEAKLEGHSNPAATADNGSQLGNTAF